MMEKQVVKEHERSAGEWLGLTLEEKIQMLKVEKRIDVSEIYTLADVWGWTWEQELREQLPEQWSQEKEVQQGIEIMLKVCWNFKFFCNCMNRLANHYPLQPEAHHF